MTFREQVDLISSNTTIPSEQNLMNFKFFLSKVQSMQNLSVLLGMNGAGLMNALYLPPYAVAIQMVPYEANVNWEYFGKILTARGPYLEWHNEHKDRHFQNMETDPRNSNANTDVHIDEVVDLVKIALGIAEEHRMHMFRDEL